MSRFAKKLRFPALALGLAIGLVFACVGDGAVTEAPATEQPTEAVATTSPATEEPTEQAAATSPPADPQPDVGHETGQRAPAFMLTTSSGEDVTLASFQGRPVVLYFFATW